MILTVLDSSTEYTIQYIMALLTLPLVRAKAFSLNKLDNW